MIPVFLISHNRLTCLSTMVEQLGRFPGVRPVVVDNASTYPPLLNYLDRVDVEVVRLGEHLGKHAPWLTGLVFEEGPYYAVSDPDLDLSGCPSDLFEVLRRALDAHPWAIKCGPSLEIDDIPGDRPWRDQVVGWERQFWSRRLDAGHFRAAIDTTLALYRSATAFAPDAWTAPAIRCDRPYTVRHTPWYSAEVTEEDRYYVENMVTTKAHWSRRIYGST